jgi:hypothetical protein
MFAYIKNFSYLCIENRRYGIGRNTPQKAAFAALGVPGE